ncbi:MAG: YscO family type III secretion system apparatus protein [Oligoflexales bacterium]|nr:YscO family type III secretion system apparatus protein [Oligoflexales bacterium]
MDKDPATGKTKHLKELKENREKQAEINAYQKKNDYDACLRSLELSKKNLDEFRMQRVSEKQKLYKRIIGEEISLKNLVMVRNKLETLAEKQKDLATKVVESEVQSREAKSNLDEAIKQHLKAQIKKEKFEDLWQEKKRLMRADMERMEENLIEDSQFSKDRGEKI